MSEQRARVLLVDDEPSLLTVNAALLEDQYDVETTSSPKAALERLATQHFDVLCTDLSLPEMDGVTLVSRALVLQPKLACALVTGRRDYDPKLLTTQNLAFLVLFKPYRPERFLELIARAVRVAQVKSQPKPKPLLKIA